MAEAGILTEDDRVELIDGEILEMSPLGRKHWVCVNRITRLFVRAVGDRAIVHIQNPIVLGDYTEPQPDLVLLRPRDDFYADMDATPDAILLLIEVADSSVDYDRRVKAPLYARMSIPEYWLADVGREHIVVHLDPTSDGYRTTRVFRRGESFRPTAFPDLQIVVDDILG
jgi:Uma2 family endonuclease